MKTVLYIDCCIRKELSRTRRLAEAFLDRLSQRQDYTIETICLMEEPLSLLSGDFFFQRERLLDEHRLNHPRFRYAHQFQQADRIVIAAPFWDLSYPALLKVYFENVCVDGITFGTAQNQLVGLCRAERMLYLTTRGGNYEGSPGEMGVRSLEALCQFWGIPHLDVVAADGLDLGLEPPEAILGRAIQQAAALAEKF